MSLCLRDFDGHVNWIRNLHFLNHWDFNFLVHRELLGVMMMDGVDLVGDLNFYHFTESNVVREICSGNEDAMRNLTVRHRLLRRESVLLPE